MDRSCNIIKIDNISFAYKNKSIFENLTAEIKAGDIVAITGENGCGKTTLLKIISQFIFPKMGSVTLETDSDKKKPIISGFLEAPKVWNMMTGRENVKYYLGDNYNKKVVEDMFKEWKLENYADKLVSKYSFGMRQRLGLIISFASNSDIILLDEPTNSLDQNSIENFWNYVHKAKDDGKIVLFTTHILYGLKDNCTHILRIEDGKLIQADYEEKKEQAYIIAFADNVDMDKVRAFLAENFVVMNNKKIRVWERDMNISQIISELSKYDIIEVCKETA